MLIDIHAYIGHWPFRQLRGNTCKGLLAKMDKYGVDKAVVGNLNGLFYKNTQPANEELFRAVQPYGDRFIPFAVINPTYTDWEHDLEVCIHELGMKGVRLYPRYHDYDITDRGCVQCVSKARDLDIPVAFTVRMTDSRQCSWFDVDEMLSLKSLATLVERVPDARYMVLHAFFLRDDKAEVFERLAKANVVFDIINGCGCGATGPSAYDLFDAIRRLGSDKFAFGTGAPLRDYVSPFLRILTMHEADEETKRLIWSGNARRVLGLD